MRAFNGDTTTTAAEYRRQAAALGQAAAAAKKRPSLFDALRSLLALLVGFGLVLYLIGLGAHVVVWLLLRGWGAF